MSLIGSLAPSSDTIAMINHDLEKQDALMCETSQHHQRSPPLPVPEIVVIPLEQEETCPEYSDWNQTEDSFLLQEHPFMGYSRRNQPKASRPYAEYSLKNQSKASLEVPSVNEVHSKRHSISGVPLFDQAVQTFNPSYNGRAPPKRRASTLSTNGYMGNRHFMTFGSLL